MAINPVRVGIVGASARYGWGQRAHIPALLAMPEIEITAVGTAHRETADESARIYGARLAFHDWRGLVTHPDIELVVICVRADKHFEIAKGALEAGKHLFCEWPVGASLIGAHELALLAKAKRVKTIVGLQSLASPAILHLRDLIARGEIGQPLTASLSLAVERYPGYRTPQDLAEDPQKGTRVLSILAGHAIDAFCFCAGEFREVAGTVRTHIGEPAKVRSSADVPPESPDAILASGVLESGAVATINVTTNVGRSSGWRMDAHGTRGTLVATAPGITNYTDTSISVAKAGHPSFEKVEPPAGLSPLPNGVPAGPPANVARLYQRVIKAIREGGDATPNLDYAVRRHRLLHAIEISSRTGQRQTLIG